MAHQSSILENSPRTHADRHITRLFATLLIAADACLQSRLPSGSSLTIVQPFYEMTLVRPWHWGIAILSAPGAAVPETLDTSLVTATGETLVIKMRHAQDIDAAVFEGDWDWATATIRVRYWADLPESAEAVAYDGVLHLVDGRLSIGDADGDVTVDSLDDVTRVRVQVVEDWGGNAADVRVDLAPQA